MIRTRTLLAAVAASSLASASGAQILLALDFQGTQTPGFVPLPVTEPGFDAFEVHHIAAVPDPTPSVNPSFTNTGGVTFSITGSVGGFGQAGSFNDDLDRDFMFLGNALGYDDLISWDVTGLAPNTEYEFTWFTGLEGNSQREATITSGAVSGLVQTDAPDLKLLLTTDGTGAVSGTAERTGSSAEANLAGLLVQVPPPPPPMKDLEAGDVFGIDLGPTPTDTVGNDFNEANGSLALAAGSVHDLNSVILNGVSVSFSGAEFVNNDGSDADYATLLPGTAVDPYFEESVVTDIAGTFSGVNGGIYTVTIEGLDDSLEYNVIAVSAADFAGAGNEELTVDGVNSSIVRGSSSDPTFHEINGVSSTGGTLTLDFVQDGGTNPIVNGIVIEVVPEPGTLALLGLGGLLVARRRRD